MEFRTIANLFPWRRVAEGAEGELLFFSLWCGRVPIVWTWPT